MTLRLLSYVVDGRLTPRPPGSVDWTVRAIEEGVDVLAGQGTGMDAGPYYLGSDEVMRLRRPDFEPLLLAAKRTGTPFVFSMGGGAGADLHLDAYLEEVGAIATDNGIKLRVAVISGEVEKDFVRSKLRAGIEIPRSIDTPRLSPLLTEDDVERSTRIQAQIGPEPIVTALGEEGIDGVITGRALDLGVLVAYPLYRGVPKALAAHAAKVSECGTMCAEPSDPHDAILVEIGEDSFTMTCRNPRSRLTARSVAMHSLYEREDPFEERNPGGILDLGKAVYQQVDDRTVRCANAQWFDASPYTVKLEGAELIGYQAGTIVGIRDPIMIEHIDEVIEYVRDSLLAVAGNAGCSVTTHVFGRDAVLKSAEPMLGQATPYELGILLVVTADTQKLAKELASIARTRFVIAPFPGRRTTAGNVAAPLQQTAFELGPAYVFNIWHLLPLEDPAEPFRRSVVEFG
jgi:hypothetical protein